jgi:hypothetical protein
MFQCDLIFRRIQTRMNVYKWDMGILLVLTLQQNYKFHLLSAISESFIGWKFSSHCPFLLGFEFGSKYFQDVVKQSVSANLMHRAHLGKIERAVIIN